MKQLTIKDVNAKVEQLAKDILEIKNELKRPTIFVPCYQGTPLSEITEIGKEIPISDELGSIRLCDLNYNGTGKKLWQFTKVYKPNGVGLGLPNNKNGGGYPNAKGIFDVLNEIYQKLCYQAPHLVSAIKGVDVPCYIPNDKEIKDVNSKLFLLSATEMCQNRCDLAKEGRPLEYYIKNTPSFNNWHWLRTPDFTSEDFWGDCYNNGLVDSYSTYSNGGVAPAFCTD